MPAAGTLTKQFPENKHEQVEHESVLTTTLIQEKPWRIFKSLSLSVQSREKRASCYHKKDPNGKWASASVAQNEKFWYYDKNNSNIFLKDLWYAARLHGFEKLNSHVAAYSPCTFVWNGLPPTIFAKERSVRWFFYSTPHEWKVIGHVNILMLCFKIDGEPLEEYDLWMRFDVN